LWLIPHWIFAKYPHAAQLLREGKLTSERLADLSPSYLLLNTLIPPTGVRWLQAALVGVCVACTFLCARRLFGGVAAWVAATLTALCAPLFLYEATLEPEVLLCAFSLSGLTLLVLARDAARTGLLSLGAGTLLGLASAARPTGLLFLAIAAAALGIRAAWHRGRSEWHAAGLLVLGGLVGVGMPMAPLRLMLGSQLGSTMSFGAVLQMGNRPESTGLGAQPPALLKLLELQTNSPDAPDQPHVLYRRFARAALGENASATATQLYWIRKTIAFVRYEPWAYINLLGRKLCFLLFTDGAHDLLEVREAEQKLSRLPLLPSSWLTILGLVGMLLSLTLGARLSWIWLYLLSNAAVALSFYVTSRYCLSMYPAWAVLGATWVLPLTKRRRHPMALGLSVATALVLILARLYLPILGDSRRVLLRANESRAQSAAMNREMAAGRFAEATEYFKRAYAAAPFMLLLRNVRGIPFESPPLADESGRMSVEKFGFDSHADLYFALVLAVAGGHCDSAWTGLLANDFRWALFDISMDPAVLAAKCLVRAGDSSGAWSALQLALRIRPGTHEALALSVAGAEALGMADAQRLRSELFAVHDPLTAQEALARAYLIWGNAKASLAMAEAVASVLPESAIAQYDRARALLAVDRSEEALDAYARALELFPAHAFETRPFEEAMVKAVDTSDAPPHRLALGVEHSIRAGRLRAALRLQQRLEAVPREVWHKSNQKSVTFLQNIKSFPPARFAELDSYRPRCDSRSPPLQRGPLPWNVTRSLLDDQP
jgi:tetratricopeptide (TPR) repeat protein